MSTAQAMQLFPIPGGPTTPTMAPAPDIAAEDPGHAVSSQAARPGGVVSTMASGIAGAEQAGAVTGESEPLMHTISGSPSTAT
jgi:hypothetical protein